MRALVWVCLLACGGSASTTPRVHAVAPQAITPAPARTANRGTACPSLVNGKDAVASLFPGCGTPPLALGYPVCPAEGCPRPCVGYFVKERGKQRRYEFEDDVIGDLGPVVTYDEHGRPRTLARGDFVAALAYDADGRLAEETLTTPTVTRRRRFRYDGDRVIAVVASSMLTTFTYDDRGRVVRMVIDAPHHAPVEIVHRYDGDRLVELGDASGRGSRTMFEYDCAGARP